MALLTCSNPIRPRWLFAAALAVFVLASGPSWVEAQTTEDDRRALQALYANTGGSNWRSKAGWETNEDNLSDWYGVSVERGRVVGINLLSNGLSGEIPRDIGGLTELRSLDLGRNEVGGEPPETLGRLSKLVTLKLFHNEFTGSIPPQLGDLGALEELNIGNNMFTGSIPVELGNLGRLQRLFLDNNQLTGAIPEELGNLVNLTHMRLNSNRLEREIPAEIGNLVMLQELWLNDNNLSGDLPEELGNLSERIFDMKLANNSGLTGCISYALRDLREQDFAAAGLPICPAPEQAWLEALYDATDGDNWTRKTNWKMATPIKNWHGVTIDEDGRLTELSLNNNGLQGGIPTDGLEELTELQYLSLERNRLSGPIPREFGDLTKLQTLQLTMNELSGAIPEELGNLTEMRNLRMCNNNLTGSIPETLGNLSELRDLFICHNMELGGDIPFEFGDLDELVRLGLNDNALTGRIPPELGDMEKLGSLALDDNQLTGEIPSALANLADTLGTLRLGGNDDLTGCVPYALRDVSTLELGTIPLCPHPDRVALELLYGATGGDNWTVNTNWKSERDLGQWHGVTVDGSGRVAEIDLSSNELTASLPTTFDGLSELQSLDLSDNTLGGPLPRWRGLRRLRSLDISGNRLIRVLTSDWADFEALQELDLSSNRLEGSLPAGLSQATDLRELRFDDNRFTSPIPSTWGSFPELRELRLDVNQLSGPIPETLGGLANLRELRLNNNNLTGDIPASLGNLARKLTMLYLANNDGLTGCIPLNLRAVTRDTPKQPFCVTSLQTALEALYDATGGDNWANKTNWKTNRPIAQWYGVTTDAGGVVVDLNLNGNGLTGDLPAGLGGLVGLQTLYLNDNVLTGAIPPELGNLGSSLVDLVLTNNMLTGAIPPELGNLDKLEELRLDNNMLTGTVPTAFANLVDTLTDIYLGGNTGLTGCVPHQMQSVANKEFGHLVLCLHPDRIVLEALYDAVGGAGWTTSTNWKTDAPFEQWHGVTVNSDGVITGIDLAGNNLAGTLTPEVARELAKLTGLAMLDFSDNGLTGEIPAEMGGLSQLTSLQLGDNQLTGGIPPELGRLSQLTTLGLGNNGLTGGIPVELGNLTLLTDLDLSGNSGLTGCIPASLDRGMTSPDALGPPFCELPPPPPPPPLEPAEQVGVVTVAPGDLRLSVSWPEAENANFYYVQWKSGDEDYDESRQVLTMETSYDIDGLTAGTEYTLRVIASRAGAPNSSPSLEVKGTPLPATRILALSLSPLEIDENGGTATVTASLNRALTTEVTVAVAVEPVAPAVAGDFTQTGTELTIAAGETGSTGVVTVTAVDNDVDATDKTLTVSAFTAIDDGVADPPGLTLTLLDDDVSLTIAHAATTPTNEALEVIFDFGNAIDPETFTAGDIVISGGGTATPPVQDGADGTVFRSRISPAANGAIRVSLAEDTVFDVRGNGNPAAASGPRTYDTSPPRLRSITRTGQSIHVADADSLAFIFTFDEPLDIRSFTGEDLNITTAPPVELEASIARQAGDAGATGAGSASSAASSSAEATAPGAAFPGMPGDVAYRVTLAGPALADYEGRLSIALADDADITDATGNPIANRTVMDANDNSYAIDNGPAMVPVTIKADTRAIDEGETITYRVTRSRRLANALPVAVALDVVSPQAPNHQTDISPVETMTIPPGITEATWTLRTSNKTVGRGGGTIHAQVTAGDTAAGDVAVGVEGAGRVSVEVGSSGLSRERRERAIENALGGFGLAVGWDMTETIRRQSRGADLSQPRMTANNMPLSWAELRDLQALWPVQESQDVAVGAFDPLSPDGLRGVPGMAGLMGVTDWNLPGIFARNPEFSLLLNPTADFDAGSSSYAAADRLLRLWGKFGVSDIDQDPFADHTQSGDVVGGYLGMDASFDSGWVVGAAFGVHNAEIDFDDSIGATQGEIDIEMQSLNPYVSYNGQQMRLWGAFGWGWGELGYEDIDEGVMAGTGSDIGQWALAGGVEYALNNQSNFYVIGRGEAMTMGLDADDAEHDLAGYDDIDMSIHGLRGEFELGWPLAFASYEVRPYAHAGLRWEGGDANGGIAVEYGGGVSLVGNGLSIDGSMRRQMGGAGSQVELTSHSISIDYEMGAGGKGFMAALRQSSGPSSRFDPYSSGALGAFAANRTAGRTDLRAGYGLALGAGLLTPYVESDWRRGRMSNLGGGMAYEFPGARIDLGYGYTPGDGVDGWDSDSVGGGGMTLLSEFRFCITPGWRFIACQGGATHSGPAPVPAHVSSGPSDTAPPSPHTAPSR